MTRRFKRKNPEPIGDILAQLMASKGFARVKSAESLDAAWREAGGAMVARYTRVGEVRQGTLEVIVDNSTLVQELSFQKRTLLANLERLLPNERIQDIRFRVGPTTWL